MTVLSTLYAFIGRGEGVLDIDLATVFMSAGSLASVHYGAAPCKRMHPRRLQKVVIGVIVLAVAIMVVDRFRWPSAGPRNFPPTGRAREIWRCLSLTFLTAPP